MILRTLLAVAVALVVAQPVLAQERNYPRFTNHVVDQAGVIPDEAEQQVNAELADYQRRDDNQIAVAAVETTGNQSIEDYANDLFDEWGIGQEGEDNGLLVVLAMEERMARIEVGFGLEDEMTDIESGRIIREVIVPRMRDGDVAGAVVESTHEIRRKLGDDQVGVAPPDLYRPEEDTGRRSPLAGLWWIIPFLIFGPLSALGRRRGRRLGWMAPVFWGGGWGGGRSGGFGGGGFGGGGFGGGGGGGSGGGGASGGW